VTEGWMDEDPTLNSPSYGFSLNICSGDSRGLPGAMGFCRTEDVFLVRRVFPM
jgi:hypothetical protein